MAAHCEPTEIHAIPAETGPQGIRLLVLREFRKADVPPAFAFIRQGILREPVRSIRHGTFFAAAFRPEVIEWLISRIGRPSLRDGTGKTVSNPRWPTLGWHGTDRLWPDGTRTTEWHIEISFQESGISDQFRKQWRHRLDGRMEQGEGSAAGSHRPGQAKASA